jgi:hypothetical protein
LYGSRRLAGKAAGLRALFPALLILLCYACANIPDSFPVPPQRKDLPTMAADPVGSFVNMNDPNAEQYFVADIGKGLEADTWRWTHKRPELRFRLASTKGWRFSMDFAIAEATFRRTGPVTLSFVVNGKLLEKVRYATSGEKHFEKLVPENWIYTSQYNTVAIQADKIFVAEGDGVFLNFTLVRAGFMR